MSDLGARARRSLLIAAGAGLAIFLFVQPGNPYDEAEHLHAAWLMSVRGLHPVRDFFEHHPPLLWHVLSIPFRLGVRGPEVLYAARLLVILCAAAFSWALFVLARRWSAKEPQELPGAPAFLLFAITLVMAQQLFVTRPETLATALLGLGLILFAAQPLHAAAGSGALLALCACASPRFVLLAPVLLLGESRPSIPWRRLGAALAGAAAAFAGFVAFLCPWQELLFDLRFSSLLQRVGLAPDVFSLVHLAACAVAAVLLWGMAFATRRVPSRAAALWAVHGAVIWVACFVSAGRFLYAQAFAPALLWAALFAAWLEAQPPADGFAAARPALLSAALCGTLAALSLQTAAASLNAYNVVAQTASRRLLLDLLPPGAHVLMMPEIHPITVDDASYFGALLSVGICDAAEAYPREHPASRVRVPTCDFLADLQRVRPEAVSRDLFLASPALAMDAVRAEIVAHYQLTDALDDAPTRAFSANAAFRKR